MTEQPKSNLLEPYITNLNDQVFSIVDLNGIVGAVMARYSRAETGMRETLLREFIAEDKLKWDKAEKLIERVLIAFGDDSVGELEGAHLAFEEISMLATKVIEHRRIGGSPIEKSTRYVRFDQRDKNGCYLYVIPPGIQGELKDEYTRSMDFIFKSYTTMWQPVHAYLKTIKPMEEAVYQLGGEDLRFRDCQTAKRQKQFERTYRNDLKTKTCDVLRAFLPLACKANVGLFGNGRFYQHLISKMLSSPLAEAQMLGEKAFVELSKVIPHYVKRAAVSKYAQTNHLNMLKLVRELFGATKNEDQRSFVSIEPDYQKIAARIADESGPDTLRESMLLDEEIQFLAALCYPYTNLSFDEIRKSLYEMDPNQRQSCYQAFYGHRKTRRDRPERSIEYGYPHHFEMVTEWAVYKDLMRHRMGTALIQPLEPHLGFEMPAECALAGVKDLALEIVTRAESLYQLIKQESSIDCEYAFLHGHRMRWLLGMNDRALMHMLELRTTPQGHPNYRKVSQHIHRALAEKFPERSARMNFVNHQPVFWSRADSEARQRDKEDKIEE
ncbi:MAG: hypothetical protein CR997_06935 [Acidobacteria bacterium]|nr:MAG: hypothetical protein CR997_06935 [Acidobacteriota bacterium]